MIFSYEAASIAAAAFRSGFEQGSEACGREARRLDETTAENDDELSARGADLVERAGALEAQRPLSPARASQMISAVAKIPGVFVFDGRARGDKAWIEVRDPTGIGGTWTAAGGWKANP